MEWQMDLRSGDGALRVEFVNSTRECLGEEGGDFAHDAHLRDGQLIGHASRGCFVEQLMSIFNRLANLHIGVEVERVADRFEVVGATAGDMAGVVVAQAPAAPVWPPPLTAWCEICRVDCNTLEFPEQHIGMESDIKINLQTHAELQNLSKVITGQQNVQMPTSEVQTEVFQPEKVDGSGEQVTQESVPSQAPHR
ncbi:hypothetical protein EZV62_009609 [Acer yangbiense]|uniref:Uncharacterized protein n=1 Tax=Acer yangbiense TaxID=1000413 RepID=A0A5C7I0N6_9ROSI|nr:hypothetical protein EZV62_009609 [Acer yangbiense]